MCFTPPYNFIWIQTLFTKTIKFKHKNNLSEKIPEEKVNYINFYETFLMLLVLMKMLNAGTTNGQILRSNNEKHLQIVYF